MIPEVPLYLDLLFLLTVLITMVLFSKSTKNFTGVFGILLGYAFVQSLIGFSGFYQVADTVPPRFLALLLPMVLVIFYMFGTSKGRVWTKSLKLEWLTLLHTIRVPVEWVLYGLFLFGQIPELMTFEGRNFDILAGLTAPFVYYGFKRGKLGKTFLLWWNIAALLLLINIVVNAILSIPSPFQQFAFDRPNMAVLYFPFDLLPAVVVPLVLIAHLAAIYKLRSKKNT